MESPASSWFGIALVAFIARLLLGGLPLIGGLISFFVTPVLLVALFGGAAILVKNKMITA